MMAQDKQYLRYFFVAAVLLGLVGESLYVAGKLAVKGNKASSPEAKMVRKLNRLVEMVSKNQAGAMEMSRTDYEELVFNPPRNHSVFVLFYNDHEICDFCGFALLAFDKVARSFLASNIGYDYQSSSWSMRDPVFFVKVKMLERHTEMLVELSPSLPNLYYFSPSRSFKYNQFEQMDSASLVGDVETIISERIQEWINHVSGIRISLEKDKPTNQMSALFSFTVFAIFIIFNVYYFGCWDALVQLVKDFNYAYFITVCVVWLLSGQMYNFIRSTPMMGNRGLNLISVIYPSMRGQYGIESVIIMILYGLIIYGVIQLIETREKRLSGNIEMSDFQSGVLSALSFIFFGFMSIQFLSQLKTGR